MPEVAGEVPEVQGEVPELSGEVPEVPGEVPEVPCEVPEVPGGGPDFAPEITKPRGAGTEVACVGPGCRCQWTEIQFGETEYPGSVTKRLS